MPAPHPSTSSGDFNVKETSICFLGNLPQKRLPSENAFDFPPHPRSQHLTPSCRRPIPKAVSKHLPLLLSGCTLKCHGGGSVRAITTLADNPQKYQLLGNLCIPPSRDLPCRYRDIQQSEPQTVSKMMNSLGLRVFWPLSVFPPSPLSCLICICKWE